MVRTRLSCWSISAFLIEAIALSSTPCTGQDFFEIVDVPLIEVDVAVTDTQGQPVLDLTKDAFTLLVDGENQDVSFFASPDFPDPGGTIEAGSLSAYLVILFDNDSVERQNRNALIEDFREFLGEDPSPFQEIMVATLSPAGLEVQEDFTNDPGLTDAALGRVSATVARDLHVSEYESLLRDIQRLSGARDPTLRDSVSQTATLVSRIIGFSERARQHAERVASHIWELTRALEGLQGRRSILYVGGAISVSPGESLLTALKGVLDRSGDGWAKKASANLPAGVASGGGRQIDSIALAASLNGVAIHSIMVGGGAQVLSTGTSVSSITAKDSSTMDSSGSWSPGFDSRTRSESRSGLEKLAEATGGFVHAMRGSAGPTLDRIRDQMNSRYVLGFHPPAGADGQPHDIRVQVDVEGARLLIRHRRSFQAHSWDEETAGALRSSLFFGVERNLHHLSLEARVPENVSKGTLRVPLTLRLPLSSLSIEPVRNTHRGQASVFVTGLGAGRFDTVPVRKSVLPVILANDELQGAMGQMAEYRLDIEVPRSSRGLAVAVRDDLSTELSIVRLAVPESQSVRVEPTTGSAPDQAPTTDDVPPVRLPSAALLMSGQQGGSLGLERQATDELGLIARVPNASSSETSRRFEIHLYVLDSGGQPVSRTSRQLRLNPTGDSNTLELPFEAIDGDGVLSVLVRDLETNDFGLARLPVNRLASTGFTGESNESSLEIRFTTQEKEYPSGTRTAQAPSGPQTPPGKGRVSLERVSLGLLEVLQMAAAGKILGAQSRLRDLEMESTSGRSPLAIVHLRRREARVVASMAKGTWERMLPLAFLWGKLYDDYRRLGLGPLSEHAMAMSTELATTMARQAETPESKTEAADLLVSLSGYLLYSQRLGKTEELLELGAKVDPENQNVLIALAATREQQGDYEGAVEVLARLLKLSPEDDEGRLRMAVNLVRTERPSEAEPIFRSLTQDAKADWVAKVATQELARQIALKEPGDDAMLLLETAIERWPDEPALQIQLAWLLDGRNRRAEADKWIGRAATESVALARSPRFRYHRWYLEGLDEVREALARVFTQRAREAIEGLVQDKASQGGS